MGKTRFRMVLLTLGFLAYLPVQHGLSHPPACRLELQGTPARGLVECTGGTITASISTGLSALGTSYGINLGGKLLKRGACGTSGCLISICGSSRAVLKLSITGIEFEGSKKQVLVCLRGRAHIFFKQPVFVGNQAAAIKTLDHSTAVIEDGMFSSNVGDSGVGVFAVGNSSVIIRKSTFLNNIADGWYAGGGVAAIEDASVIISDQSTFAGNMAIKDNAGGAIAIHGDAYCAIQGKTSIVNNTGEGGGGGLVAFDSAHVDIKDGTTFISNTAMRGGGGGISANNDATISISGGCVLDGNVAEDNAGGSIGVYGNSSVSINESVIKNGWSTYHGGGIYVEGSAVVQISRSMLLNNSGGVMAAGEGDVLITDGSHVVFNTAPAGGFGGGGLLMMREAKVVVMGNSTISGNTAAGVGGGGMSVGGASSLVLHDIILRENRASSGGAVDASGEARVNITGTTWFESNTARMGSDLNIGPNVEFFLAGSNINAESDTIVWLRTSNCSRGEVLVGGFCQKCVMPTYNLDPFGMGSCHMCPAQANCTGGHAIIPLEGYWHCNKYSTQIHKCPHVDPVCGYHGSCSAGYTGNVCASCELGYGSVGPFNCSLCMSARVQWALYMSGFITAVLLVVYLIHAAWRDNRYGDNSVRASDVVKVAILFGQYLVILSSLSVPWPVSMSGLFKAANFIFGAVSGQIASIDCMLRASTVASIPLAVLRQLLYLLAPFGLLAGVFVVFTLHWVALHAWQQAGKRLRKAPNPLLGRVPVMCVVVLLFCYPFLVRVALGFFACVPLDDAQAVDDPFPHYAIANATHGYWVHSMDQACWEGWHLKWALGVGLPCALILCIAVPAAVTLGLTCNKSKLNSLGFRSHYGLLYRKYRGERYWWEGAMVVQTILLVAVSVFRYTLGNYFAALLLNAVFGAALAMQLFFKPYESRKLHHLQIMATACLYMTAYFALSLFTVDVDSPPVYQQVIAGFAVALNCSFFLWCAFLSLRESKGPVVRFLRAARDRILAGCGRRGSLKSTCGATRIKSTSGSSFTSSSSKEETPVKHMAGLPSTGDSDVRLEPSMA